MKLDDATFERWDRWGELIYRDLTHSLAYPRQCFRVFNEVVSANSAHVIAHGGVDFFNFVAQGYVTRVMMAIRRHTKSDKNAVSFMRLLEQVEKCAPQFTLGVYLTRHPNVPEYLNWQELTFRQFSDDGCVVSSGKVRQDIACLESLAENVVTECDKAIAHLDKQPSLPAITFGDLERCVSKFDELACKYFKLTTKKLTGLVTLEPVPLVDFHRILTVPIDLRNTSWTDGSSIEE